MPQRALGRFIRPELMLLSPSYYLFSCGTSITFMIEKITTDSNLFLKSQVSSHTWAPVYFPA